MIVDNNTLIGVVAGSATAALCGYAYYLYRDKKKKENMRDKQCQVYQPTVWDLKFIFYIIVYLL